MDTSKIIFIGNFVSEEESLLDYRVSQAGNNFQIKLIHILSPDLVIKLVPIFFEFKKIIKNPEANHIQIISKSFFKGRLNYYYRFVFDTLKAIHKICQSKIRNVFFYNIDKQNFAIILYLFFLTRRKIFIIVADHSAFKKKSLFEKICIFLLKNVTGLIVLNSNIKINPVQITIAGLVEEKEILLNNNYPLNNNVLLSGSLGKTTGFELTLKTFAKRSDLNLFITGNPYKYSTIEFQEIINNYCSKCPNIKYLGLLTKDQYLDILNVCDIALSLRNPEDLEHQYNFPSKILEYLAKSKFVISTLEYNDLPQKIIFYSNFDSVALSETLDKIIHLDGAQIMKLRQEANEYLLKNFTEKHVYLQISQFILKSYA